MPNKIVHFEIGCRDREKTGEFFGKLFDWKMEERDGDPPITKIETGGKVNGHIVSLGHEPHNYSLIYVHVESVEASIQKAIELGGKHVAGPVCFPVGRFACIADPEGNNIGLFESAKENSSTQGS